MSLSQYGSSSSLQKSCHNYILGQLYEFYFIISVGRASNFKINCTFFFFLKNCKEVEEDMNRRIKIDLKMCKLSENLAQTRLKRINTIHIADQTLTMTMTLIRKLVHFKILIQITNDRILNGTHQEEEEEEETRAFPSMEGKGRQRGCWQG